MKRYLTTLILFSLLLFCLSSTVWARGGGGCLLKGTLIETLKGTMPIESLQRGDWVWSSVRGERHPAQVVTTIEVEPDHFLQIKLNNGLALDVTDEHLFAINKGEFRRAASLHPSDQLITWNKNHWQKQSIFSIKKYKSKQHAFNILVDKGTTYIANGILVHNKGCFLPNTPILRADGSSVAINQIHSGDMVKAFELDGTLTTTTVRAILIHQVNSYYIVTTQKIILNVTEEHPFYVGNGSFKTVEALSPDDVIYAFDGDQLAPQRILRINAVHALTTVYNLQTNVPHTFFAAGIAVHNKGGGGGGGGGGGRHSRHGSSSASDTFGDLIAFFWIVFWAVFSWRKRAEKNEEDLDFTYSPKYVELIAVPKYL